jgi:GT2 family glycosyltransferase
VPAACEILDDVLLAIRKSVLMEHDLRFDMRFDFHFYDLDFCREARESGLTLGTWPIAITHQSGGAFFWR